MKILKLIIVFIIGFLLYFAINATFMFQHLSITFFTATIIYLIIGTIIQYRYKVKQKRIISFLILITPFLFALGMAYNNKLLIPFYTPGLFLVAILNFFLGFFLAFIYKKRKYLFYTSLILWFVLILYVGLVVFPQIEYKENNIIEKKPLIQYTLLGLKNDTLTSEQCKNKVVVMDFWTTTCGVCYRLFPKIQELSDHYKNNKDVIIIAVNDGKTDSISKFMKAKGVDKYTFPFMYDISKTLNSFLQIKAYPLTCIIDKKGNIRYKHRGCGHDEVAVMVPNLIEQIDVLLAE